MPEDSQVKLAINVHYPAIDTWPEGKMVTSKVQASVGMTAEALLPRVGLTERAGLMALDPSTG